MPEDTPPHDTDVLAIISDFGGQADPEALISRLLVGHSEEAVIEALQRAIERGKISLNHDGMVVATQSLAHAA